MVADNYERADVLDSTSSTSLQTGLAHAASFDIERPSYVSFSGLQPLRWVYTAYTALSVAYAALSMLITVPILGSNLYLIITSGMSTSKAAWMHGPTIFIAERMSRVAFCLLYVFLTLTSALSVWIGHSWWRTRRHPYEWNGQARKIGRLATPVAMYDLGGTIIALASLIYFHSNRWSAALSGLGLFVHFGLSFTIAREHRSVAQYRVPVPGDLEFTALSSLLLVCSVVQLIESGAAVTVAASWVWMGSSSDEADTEQHGPVLGQLVMFCVAAIRIAVFLLTAYLSLVTGSLGVAISGKHLCSNCDTLAGTHLKSASLTSSTALLSGVILVAIRGTQTFQDTQCMFVFLIIATAVTQRMWYLYLASMRARDPMTAAVEACTSHQGGHVASCEHHERDLDLGTR